MFSLASGSLQGRNKCHDSWGKLRFLFLECWDSIRKCQEIFIGGLSVAVPCQRYHSQYRDISVSFLKKCNAFQTIFEEEELFRGAAVMRTSIWLGYSLCEIPNISVNIPFVQVHARHCMRPDSSNCLHGLNWSRLNAMPHMQAIQPADCRSICYKHMFAWHLKAGLIVPC